MRDIRTGRFCGRLCALIVTALVLTGAWQTAGGAAAEPSSLPSLDEDATLQDYLRYAALNNAGLKAAFNRWKAALERVPQMKSLPDPKFVFGQFIENVETRVGPQEQKFGLSQMFPWFGTLGLRGDVAGEEAKATYEKYEAAKLRLFYQVKDAYYEYYYLSRALAITKDNVRLLKHFESVAQAQYKAGAPVSGVIKAQVELGKLDDRQRTLEDLREPIVARLNAALNRSHDISLPWPKEAPQHKVDFSNEDLFESLAETSPELKSLAYAVTKEEKAIRLARKAYYPDFMVGVDYVAVGDALNPDTPESGKDAVMGMIGIDIPIWRGKYRAGVEEARRKREAASQMRRDAENQIGAGLKMALYRFHDAERKINLYGSTLVPEAEQGLNVTEEAYRAGKVDFLSLIDAERLLLEFQLAHERALADREQRLAEIEMLAGRSLGLAAGDE